MSQRFTVTKADEESRIGEKTLDNGSYGAVPINSVQLNVAEGRLLDLIIIVFKITYIKSVLVLYKCTGHMLNVHKLKNIEYGWHYTNKWRSSVTIKWTLRSTAGTGTFCLRHIHIHV